MLPDRVSNPGPLTYESGALPIALRGPALYVVTSPQKFLAKLLLIRTRASGQGLMYTPGQCHCLIQQIVFKI